MVGFLPDQDLVVLLTRRCHNLLLYFLKKAKANLVHE